MPKKQNNSSEISGEIVRRQVVLQKAVQDCLDNGLPLSKASIVRKNRKLSIMLASDIPINR